MAQSVVPVATPMWSLSTLRLSRFKFKPRNWWVLIAQVGLSYAMGRATRDLVESLGFHFGRPK
jgi:hypothetical protein